MSDKSKALRLVNALEKMSLSTKWDKVCRDSRLVELGYKKS